MAAGQAMRGDGLAAGDDVRDRDGLMLLVHGARFEALHGATLTPLVGREEEIDLLRRQRHRAKRGDGRVVLLSGEPGIGKSRLTAALHQRIENEPHTRMRYFCSPHHQDSALHPIIAQLERAAAFEREGNARC